MACSQLDLCIATWTEILDCVHGCLEISGEHHSVRLAASRRALPVGMSRGQTAAAESLASSSTCTTETEELACQLAG